MNIKLIAFDLDGTLLGSDQVPMAEGLRALEKAAAKGCIIVPATGRALSSVPSGVLSIEGLRYLILVNGGNIYDLKAQTPIFQNLLPAAQCRGIFQYLQQFDICTDFYIEGKMYTSRHCYDHYEKYIYGERLQRKYLQNRIPTDNLLTLLDEMEKPPKKMFLHILDDEKCVQLRHCLKAYFGVSVTSSIEKSLEVGAVDTDKGNALIKICSRLNIPINQVMAIGDNENDLGMLQVAGYSVAMGNATLEAKEQADYITDDNDNNGVAKIILDMVL